MFYHLYILHNNLLICMKLNKFLRERESDKITNGEDFHLQHIWTIVLLYLIYIMTNCVTICDTIINYVANNINYLSVITITALLITIKFLYRGKRFCRRQDISGLCEFILNLKFFSLGTILMVTRYLCCK